MFPAIDAGTPVSRIGGKAQHPAIARECRRLRLDYPQFLELELFTRFCTRLDENMTSRVQRGKLLRALLRQGRLAPRSPTYQMAWLVALKQGWLDGQDERAELLGELRDIVQAMKNVAFAELQRLNRDLPALAEARDAVHQVHRLAGDRRRARILRRIQRAPRPGAGADRASRAARGGARRQPAPAPPDQSRSDLGAGLARLQRGR